MEAVTIIIYIERFVCHLNGNLLAYNYLPIGLVPQGQTERAISSQIPHYFLTAVVDYEECI